jgi:hypothetical protein
MTIFAKISFITTKKALVSPVLKVELLSLCLPLLIVRVISFK